jgi:acyl-CoA thioester hydrolase
MHYAVASHRHGKIAAEGDGRIVTFNYAKGRKASLPATVRERIETLEGDHLRA